MNKTSLLIGTLKGILQTASTDSASVFSSAIALRDRLNGHGGWDEHRHMLEGALYDIDEVVSRLQRARKAVEQAKPVAEEQDAAEG